MLDLDDALEGGVAALREADHPRAGLARDIRADQVARPFKTSQQLVDRLLAHAGALGQRRRADAIRPRILQHRDMWQAQFIKPGVVEFADHPTVDRLRRGAQQGADQRILQSRGSVFDKHCSH